MTSRDFCYWLRGYFELEALTSNDPDKLNLTDKQFQCVKNHLNMVFKHGAEAAATIFERYPFGAVQAHRLNRHQVQLLDAERKSND